MKLHIWTIKLAVTPVCCWVFAGALPIVLLSCGPAGDSHMDTSESSSSSRDDSRDDSHFSGAEEPEDEGEPMAMDEAAPDDEFPESPVTNRRILPRGGTPTAGFTRETVYFVTNRNQIRDVHDDPDEYFGTRRAQVQFGSCAVSIPYDRDVGTLPEPSLRKLEFHQDPKKHIVLLEIELSSREKFLQQVRSKVGESTSQDILVFIHGYHVDFRDAARRTAQLSYDLNFQGAAVFFSWPSGNNVNYLADLRNAEASVEDCAVFLRLIAEQTGARRVHIIAHSMGNFVLTNALREVSLEDGPPPDDAPLFQHIVLAAPDIDAATFLDRIAPRIRPFAKKYTVYVSGNDVALLASQKASQWSPLGRPGAHIDPIATLPFIDVVDVSSIESDRWFDTGHSYYGDMPEVIREFRGVFSDLAPGGRHLTAQGLFYVLHP